MNIRDTIEAGFGGVGNARASLPAGSQYNPEQTNWNREAQRKGGPDKGGIVAKKIRKTKTLKSEATSSQSESYNVTDYMDRVLHRFKTRDEAEHASAGNRYTRVKTQRPAGKEFDLSPVIKKKPFDKIGPGRRSASNQSPFSSAPQGR